MKLKRFIALFLSAIILLTFTACSKQKTPDEILAEVKTNIENAAAIEISTALPIETKNETEKAENYIFNINAVINTDNSESKIIITATKGDSTYDVTDIILDKNKIAHINAKELLNFVNTTTVLDDLISEEDHNDSEEEFNINFRQYAALLASLELPEYISVSLNNETNTNNETLLSESQWLIDVAKIFYLKATTDEHSISYNKKDKTLNLIIDQFTADILSESINEYALESSDNFYIILENVNSYLPAESIDKIYTELSNTLDLSEEDTEYYDYINVIKAYEKEIKDLTESDQAHLSEIVKKEIFNTIKDAIDGKIIVSLDTVNKYIVTVKHEKTDKDNEENKEVTTTEIKVNLLEEKTEIKTPENSKELKKVMESLFSNTFW